VMPGFSSDKCVNGQGLRAAALGCSRSSLRSEEL
jgi:hypothetical protein